MSGSGLLKCVKGAWLLALSRFNLYMLLRTNDYYYVIVLYELSISEKIFLHVDKILYQSQSHTDFSVLQFIERSFSLFLLVSSVAIDLLLAASKANCFYQYFQSLIQDK